MASSNKRGVYFMRITGITVLCFFTLVLWIMQILNKPNLLSANEQLITLWYQQLWFFQGIFTILIIADTFYFLIKDKK